MSDDSTPAPKCPPAGAPAWVMTFADLMSLLMCFFVLLLSFATMDAVRFKKMADSLKDAFGVQKEVPVYEIVKGTSVIAQHFSPAPTEPTPLEEVKQTTTLEDPNVVIPEDQKEKLKRELQEAMEKKTEEEAGKIVESLKDEITKGLVSVETDKHRIIIRIHEKGSFPSGSAVLNAAFSPVMQKITAAVRESPGNVVIAGHTDNIPIHTDWYRSNWELSSARAVTVAHEILKDKSIDTNRMVIEGHAETEPLALNDSGPNRAKNRRVEIILVQPDLTLSEAVSDNIIHY